MTLAALGHTEVPNSIFSPTYFEVGVQAHDYTTNATQGFSVEFRRGTGWDRAMSDSVLIHTTWLGRHQAGAWSPTGSAETFLNDDSGGPQWYAGQIFYEPDTGLQITVDSINTGASTATITITKPGASTTPNCQLVFKCPYAIYTPPDYTVTCPYLVDFYEQSPGGEITLLGTDTKYSSTSSDYDIKIKACFSGSLSCTSFEVGTSPPDWCAPPPPPPPPGGGGGKGGCPAGPCQ